VTWRRQLPAYSPLTLKAVGAGAAGLVAGAKQSRAAVTAWLTEAYGCDDALLTDSGTGALTLAIRGSLAQAPGASVALPAYGCYDLATAADGASAPVVLYDLDPATLAPDPASLARALAHGARAVVLAHWYGMPVDPEAVREAAREAGAILIEDAAQAAGATWQGRLLGSFGDLTVLSFGRGKGTTAGRGGALLARGAAGSAALGSARPGLGPAAEGRSEYPPLVAQWLLGRPSVYALPAALPFLHLGETLYHAPAPVRAMSAVAARALAVTLRLGDRELGVRRSNARRLLVKPASGVTWVRAMAGSAPGYLRLPSVAAAATRAAAVSAEARALGIMPGYPRALCDLRGFGRRVLNKGDGFPAARTLAERLITLPTHSLLAESDLVGLETWLARH
jgi:dTDP-4-amino-4,6-dideoxygalactose transaminase